MIVRCLCYGSYCIVFGCCLGAFDSKKLFDVFLTAIVRANLLLLPCLCQIQVVITNKERMKKTLLVVVFLAVAVAGAQAQIALFGKKNKGGYKSAKDSMAMAAKPVAEIIATPKVKKDYSKIDVSNRTADHFMLQFGSDTWTNRPDSVRTKGFSRHFNLYFMLDKPFKNDPRYSVGFGAGIGSSNMFFDKTYVNLKGTGSTLAFTNQDGADHYNKFKLTTIFLELPVELRYFSNPENANKSWKFAVGAKVGTLLKAYTKGKDWQNKDGRSYFGSSYISKEYSKKFINSTKVAVSGRVGYGIFSLHGDFQITPIIKDGYGPSMNAYSIGLCVSGL